MKKLIDIVRRNPGILFNLVFSLSAWLYGLYLRQMILGYAQTNAPGSETAAVNHPVGFVLLFALTAETVGMFYKTRDMRYRLSQPAGAVFEEPLKQSGIMIMVAILHIVGAFLIGTIMITAFGIPFEQSGWIILFLIFIRELYLWYLAFLSTSERSAGYGAVSAVKKFIGNAGLVAYGLVAYTIAWERFALSFGSYLGRPGLFSSAGSIIQFIFVVAGIVLMCLVLFVPTRFGFILEEATFMKEKNDRRVFMASLAIAVASAILQYA